MLMVMAAAFAAVKFLFGYEAPMIVQLGATLFAIFWIEVWVIAEMGLAAVIEGGYVHLSVRKAIKIALLLDGAVAVLVALVMGIIKVWRVL